MDLYEGLRTIKTAAKGYSAQISTPSENMANSVTGSGYFGIGPDALHLSFPGHAFFTTRPADQARHQSPKPANNKFRRAKTDRNHDGQNRPISDGVRYLYLAGLEKLREENLLLQAAKFSDKENLKNLRMKIGENHQSYLAFKELTGIFQEKWYGFKDCQAPDYHLAESKLVMLDGLRK